ERRRDAGPVRLLLGGGRAPAASSLSHSWRASLPPAYGVCPAPGSPRGAMPAYTPMRLGRRRHPACSPPPSSPHNGALATQPSRRGVTLSLSGMHADGPVHALAKTMPEHTCGNVLIMASDSACIAATHTQ